MCAVIARSTLDSYFSCYAVSDCSRHPPPVASLIIIIVSRIILDCGSVILIIAPVPGPRLLPGSPFSVNRFRGALHRPFSDRSVLRIAGSPIRNTRRYCRNIVHRAINTSDLLLDVHLKPSGDCIIPGRKIDIISQCYSLVLPDLFGLSRSSWSAFSFSARGCAVARSFPIFSVFPTLLESFTFSVGAGCVATRSFPNFSVFPALPESLLLFGSCWLCRRSVFPDLFGFSQLSQRASARLCRYLKIPKIPSSRRTGGDANTTSYCPAKALAVFGRGGQSYASYRGLSISA